MNVLHIKVLSRGNERHNIVIEKTGVANQLFIKFPLIPSDFYPTFLRATQRRKIGSERLFIPHYPEGKALFFVKEGQVLPNFRNLVSQPNFGPSNLVHV